MAGDEPTLDAGLAKVKAKLLVMPSQSDFLVYPKYSQEAAEHLKKLEKTVQYPEFLVMAVTTIASMISILSATRSRNF